MKRFRLADVSFFLGAVVGVLVLGAPWTYVDAQETSSPEITNFSQVPDTGQQACWDENGNPILCAGTGQDGELQRGMAWPTPRFTDNGDGTVLDNLTGLLWLKNANCFGRPRTWQEALDAANNLADPSVGLRTPVERATGGCRTCASCRVCLILERSLRLCRARIRSPAWREASTGRRARAPSPLDAWGVVLIEGSTFSGAKFLTWYVWPVRDGPNLPPE